MGSGYGCESTRPRQRHTHTPSHTFHRHSPPSNGIVPEYLCAPLRRDGPRALSIGMGFGPCRPPAGCCIHIHTPTPSPTSLTTRRRKPTNPSSSGRLVLLSLHPYFRTLLRGFAHHPEANSEIDSRLVCPLSSALVMRIRRSPYRFRVAPARP